LPFSQASAFDKVAHGVGEMGKPFGDDVMSATPAATTASTATVGQELDAEIAVVKARLAVLEAKASTDWAAVKTWVKTNIPHFVTWASVTAVAAKVGVVADITKFL
jgi:hypothetical protein